MSDVFAEFKSTYPVVIEFPIHWGDMDAFNHVNNVMYFRYFESARIAYMEKTQMLAEMEGHKLGPILASTECRYRRPLTYPDNIQVGCRTTHVGEQDLIQEYAIFSSQQKILTTLGKARIVMVDYQTGNKVDVHASIQHAIKAIESA